MRRFILFLSSNAGLGYAPVASGTFGTLAGIPAFWLLAQLPPWLWLLTWAALLCLSFWVSAAAGQIYGVVDDGRIVIDELVGYLVTVALLPFSWWAAGLGFLYFRLFDIVKPPPARWFDQKLKNGYGVVLDDVAAGLYAALALRLSLWLFNING
ncbi:MAG: phosphatidylglycerophosphatase A [Desulfuromonadales bacterium GWD2_61_12]|nr:MAG: phosphatidylglycerophosphatase A [Desulfuromonadales bacterium GWC2_61_20]OGR36753.1 MAG: phosphatidylglycerophosphatase A [Desulfuromonadales bacterium GWD2_61_12]HAD04020.1 phosphatidylglycerophosphatase A [Desulfuromonas sp.]